MVSCINASLLAFCVYGTTLDTGMFFFIDFISIFALIIVYFVFDAHPLIQIFCTRSDIMPPKNQGQYAQGDPYEVCAWNFHAFAASSVNQDHYHCQAHVGYNLVQSRGQSCLWRVSTRYRKLIRAFRVRVSIFSGFIGCALVD
jgi:hypothetical protein